MTRARVLLRTVVAGVAAATTSCAPCAGTTDCTTPPRFVLLGAIVEPASGQPMRDMRVDFRLSRGGVDFAAGTLQSGADGLFEMRASGLGLADSAQVDVVITLDATTSYAVPSFMVAPTTRGGDAVRLGPWNARPYVMHQVGVSKNQAPLVHAQVRFTPTHGVAVPGAPDWTGETNGAGIFELPQFGTAVGNVRGTLTIEHPDLGTPRVIVAYPVPVGFRYVLPRVGDVIGFQ